MNTTVKDWERCVAFHGHACPGLAIGVRACEAAAAHLGITMARDEEVVCVTENDACGVDAVQVLAGCSVGKGNLILRNTGKMAFSFFCRSRDTAVRLVFRKPMAGEGMDRAAMQHHILTAPLEELFDCKAPPYALPDKARLFASVVCEECGESCAEHCARLHEGRKVCLDCFAAYSRGW
ncbi:MAG: FmdE family protein [Thermodesulfobacteriota bacterium]